MADSSAAKDWDPLATLFLRALSPSKLGVDERVKLATVEHGFDIPGFDAGADVLHAAVVQDVITDLAAEGDALGVADDLAEFLVALGLLECFELAHEDAHG